jgi:hypothetical protein
MTGFGAKFTAIIVGLTVIGCQEKSEGDFQRNFSEIGEDNEPDLFAASLTFSQLDAETNDNVGMI